MNEPLSHLARLSVSLPAELLGKVWKGRYGGQQQKWLALRFLGADSDVNIQTRHPEFDRWQWMLAGDLVARIVPFKRAVYEQVFRDFRQLLA